MGLKEYVKKRDFKQTTEPSGGRGSGKTLSFVVQRHHATRLHYDLRLELDGTLKSWAVPKGPSMNPQDKRLAMMVEDHPIDYQHFEGIIPKENYGAGVVMIWDHGTYTSLAEKRSQDTKRLREGLKSGNLKVNLNGEKLKGEFALVKLHNAEDNAWLLIKHNDAYAVKQPYDSEDLVPQEIKAMLNNKNGKATKLPRTRKSAVAEVDGEADAKNEPGKEKAYTPMMARLEAGQVIDKPDWFYEKKLDGYRAIGYAGKKTKLISRNGIDFSRKYETIVEALKKIELDAILDGELVVEDHNGQSSFQDLQNYQGDPSGKTLKYYVFDLLNLSGHDLRGLELFKRKALLKKLIVPLKSKRIIYNEYVEGKGSDLFRKAQKEKWEGIIGKDAQSYYVSGKRSDRWLKFKLQNSQEAIICGYTHPGGSRQHFGALILAVNEEGRTRYIGNCGTGFDQASIKALYEKMHPLETDKKPFEDKVHQRTGITWIKPQLVCEVWYAEWTSEGHLRHPVYKGLRMDKEKENVVMETPETQAADQETIQMGKAKFTATHLNKLFWKDEGITKGDLLHYYRDMADWVLPYIKDKAINMRRQPNGIADEGFFHKDTSASSLPEWIKSEPLYSESNDKNINYIIGKDAATLIYLANLGCIEINPWLSSYKTPDNPDFVVIDIDPHDVPFTEAVEVALKTKEIFDRMSLDAFVKTSGSKGLHIYCYVGAKYDYDFSKLFAEYVANLIHNELPETTSVERSPAKRKNKTYIDFLQNRRGQTIACPYSVRPKPGATVSAPLHWHEVNNNLKLSDYTIHNMRERVKAIDDPWKSLTKNKADLKKGLEILRSL